MIIPSPLYPCVMEPVALPENITQIETQADLYTYGVSLISFLEVMDEAEAVERAEGRKAYLLKSRVLENKYYLIFPHVVVGPYVEKGKNKL